jgi:hypothetical protein
MKNALHHYLWLLRRFRWALLLYALLWVTVAFVHWNTGWGIQTDDYARMSHWMLLAAGGLLWLRALQQDPLPGTVAFWRTRPVRGPSLWASQAVFLFTGIAGPPLACWLLSGILLDNTAAQWRAGLWEATLIVCPLVAVAGVASFACRSLEVVVAAFAGIVAWLAGGWFKTIAGEKFSAAVMPGFLENQVGSLFLYPAACCLAAWMWAFKPGHGPVRRVALVVALLLGPAALSHLLPRSLPDPTVQLPLYSPVSAAAGAHDFGGAKVGSIPPGRWPLLQESSLRSADGVLAGVFNGKQSLTSLPAAAFASLVPADTRFYHRLPEREPQRWEAEVVAHSWNTWSGHVRGVLVAPEVLLTMPLTAGAVHAENGTRVCLRGLHVSGQDLIAAADVFLAAPLGQTVRSRLTSHGRYQGMESLLLPVLHFPNAGFAIALEPAERELFRTWQTDAVRVELRTAVPLAESLLGADWSPATLDGARFLLCHLRPAGEFIALPPAESPAP